MRKWTPTNNSGLCIRSLNSPKKNRYKSQCDLYLFIFIYDYIIYELKKFLLCEKERDDKIRQLPRNIQDSFREIEGE